MLCAGIDVGSTTTKAVVICSGNNNGEHQDIVGRHIMKTTYNHAESAERCLNAALADAGEDRNDIVSVVGTGYGRNNIEFATKKVSEIVCHGRGAQFLFPDAMTIIDIGGQDSKVIKINETGKISDFVMNEKCAAGTGRFIEVISNVLDLDVKEVGKLSLESSKALSISSMCAVFAESEVISLIAHGQSRPDILHAIHNAIADRVISMGKRIGIHEQIIMTGGVAQNCGIVKSFEEKLSAIIAVPEDPQSVGALGAAIIAAEETVKAC
jgi:predicted CoA-substrate-specific enzyme activase